MDDSSSEVTRLRAENEQLRAEIDRERLGLAVIMSRPKENIDHPAARAVVERDEARMKLMEQGAEIGRLRAKLERQQNAPWFVVHQRDGQVIVESFTSEGAERAAKLRARDHATNWSEVYIMQGQRVRGGDFEDEAKGRRNCGTCRNCNWPHSILCAIAAEGTPQRRWRDALSMDAISDEMLIQQLTTAADGCPGWEPRPKAGSPS